MSTPPHRSRQGAHRGRRSLPAAVLSSLLAVLAVTSLVTAVLVWRGQPPERPGSVSGATQGRSGTPATSPPAGDGQTGTPATNGAATGTGSPSSPAEPSGAAAASRGSPSDVEVVVLNQTSRPGLAGRVATRLRAKGWTVALVGNFRGVVPATTVYYPPRQAAAARAVAAALAVTPRTRPRFGNLSTTRVTVVLTASYPG